MAINEKPARQLSRQVHTLEGKGSTSRYRCFDLPPARFRHIQIFWCIDATPEPHLVEYQETEGKKKFVSYYVEKGESCISDDILRPSYLPEVEWPHACTEVESSNTRKYAFRKKPCSGCMAERVGFEPTAPFGQRPCGRFE